MYRVIKASTDNLIPESLNQYYITVTDDEIEDLSGYTAHPSPAEECLGYDIEHISWCVPKGEFREQLGNAGLDFVELLKEGSKYFLGYAVKGQIYQITKEDVDSALY